MSSNFGTNLKISIFGESHGEGIGVVIDGLPAGIVVSDEFICSELERRRARSDGTTTPRLESDIPKILSGVYEGKTCGTPLCAVFENANKISSHYSNPVFRPSHADYTASLRYGGYADMRGGGHFSGRLTAPLVFAGAIAECALDKMGIKIVSHISKLHGISDASLPEKPSEEIISQLKGSAFPVIDENAKYSMLAEISSVRRELDSIGGVIECGIFGVPGGLGNPMFAGVESVISSIVFGIPAVKGIEFGGGFEMCDKRASEVNDPFQTDGNSVFTEQNNSGGIQGGITNGMPIVFRTAIKPTPSIASPQKSVDPKTGENVLLEIKGRHDPCILSRAAVVVESAAAIAMLDIILSTPENER